MPALEGRRIAILATDGFEQSELEAPREALNAAGARVEVIAPGDARSIRGWDRKDWGQDVPVDTPLGQARAADYDALVLPGGQMNPDVLRTDPAAVAFVRDFGTSGRPLAAICHGPWILLEAGLVAERRVTSWPSLKTDLVNAGAHWEDSEVVLDRNLITSRKPDDLPAFNAAIIRALTG